MLPPSLIDLLQEAVQEAEVGEDDGLESLIPKFASEKIEPENVAELSDEVLSRLGLTTIGDGHRLHVPINK